MDAKDLHDGWPAGAKYLEVNFALVKGKLIQGQVIDNDTKQPVAGAAVVYQPAHNNPNSTAVHDFKNTVLTGPDGRFKLTALSGPGVIAVETADETYRRLPLKSPHRGLTVYPQGSEEIDVPKADVPKPVEIRVRKGVSLEARIIGPDGRLVPDVTVMYAGIDAALIDIWNQGRDIADGLLQIRGADPEKTYRVFMVKPEDRLGAVAELKYDPKHPGPIEVKLRPTAAVRGRIATPMGTPAADAHVMPLLVIGALPREPSRQDLFNQDMIQFYTNVLGQRNFYFLSRDVGSKGEFAFEAMIPGAGFYISASAAGREAYVSVLGLKPGELRDLGTITPKEQRR
jgi:hypothetical protein